MTPYCLIEVPEGIILDRAKNSSDFKQMTKEQLIEIAKKLLETDANLDFLSKLSNSELENLVAAIRNRVENFGES